MSGKPPSWKDVIDQRRKEAFVGRIDQLGVFCNNFAGNVPNYLVFAVTGQGGVGKSTLLKQYEAIARLPANGAYVITSDDRHPTPTAAMGHIACELAAYGAEHKGFDERYRKCRQLRRDIEADPKAPRPVVDLLARGVTDFTFKSLRQTPGLGILLENADEKAAGEVLAQLVNYGIDRWGNKDEVQLLREPELVLTPLFVQLLGSVCDERRLVLMFDVFERTGHTLSTWLRALLDFEYGEFSVNLTFVISGRDQLEQHWTELACSVCPVALEPFDLSETRQYLTKQGVSDDGLIAQIFADTGGLPVLVELLAGTKPKPGAPLPDISEDAVERFLQWTPQEDRRRVALVASVPRQFNRDILSAALGGEATDMFNWLTAQSYVRSTGARGYFYHERVRELILRYLRNTVPADLAAAHARLRDFFAGRQKALGLRPEDAYNSETWQRLEQERVFHAVSEEPDQNVGTAANAFLHAFRWRWDFASNIVEASKQAGLEMSSRSVQEFVSTISGIYLAYEQDEYDMVVKKVESLESFSALTNTARCEMYALRAWAYSGKGRYEEALADFDRAVSLDEKYDWAIVRRGETYFQMGRYEEALADFDRAVSLDEKYTWAIARRGQTYFQLDRYEEALADFDRAVSLDEKYAWAIARRGVTYFQMGRYEEALADFDRAVSLDEKYAWAIARRGETYRRLGLWQKAICDFSASIELDATDLFPLNRRAAAYSALGNAEAAQKDIARALALSVNGHTEVYEQAVPLVLADKDAEAMETLKRAFEKHTADRMFAQTDDLLDPLRTLPDFADMLT